MIFVVVSVRCKPGCRESFLREFHEIVPVVLQEEGCIEYGPAIDAVTDIENQNSDPDRLMILEKWESLDTLKAHLAAPHMVDYRPKVKDFIESSELRILDPA